MPVSASTLPEDLAVAAFALARRYSVGATMWCTSPRWGSHSRHVAVEFVHPVIVGKRALPAVHVEGPDVVGTVRLLARPGDVILALGGSDDRDVGAVLRRAAPWGLMSLLLGTGPRPAAGAADHVLWAEPGDATAPDHPGTLVPLYHLLWELTHVALEHPGLLAESAPVDADDVCITCSDEGRIAEVVLVHADGRALVVAEGHRETVDVRLIDTVGPGDLVLVHAGVAITNLVEVTP